MAKEYCAGLFGGAAGVLVGHPFDTVKVRLQTQGLAGVEMRYRGMMHCFRDILKTESLAGMFKGVGAPAAGIIFQNGIVFGIQRSTMSLLQPEGGPIKIRNSVLGGAAAGFFQSFVLSPVELVKLRMQMQGIGKWEVFFEFDGHHSSPGAHKHYNNLWDCCAKVYRTEKLKGIYRGFGITVIRDVVGFAIYFGLFDSLCQYQAKRKGISIDELNLFNLIMIGGISGLLSWIPNYPMDVIKTRIQADGVEGINKYSGIIDCCKKAYRNDGMATFFKGINPTLIRAFPTNAAIFATFVMAERWFRKHSYIF